MEKIEINNHSLCTSDPNNKLGKFRTRAPIERVKENLSDLGKIITLEGSLILENQSFRAIIGKRNGLTEITVISENTREHLQLLRQTVQTKN